ncbi:MAG: YjjG family noncanonical pyrimidine nucleotidase [Clostridia bacterium]|nr:YjjG family noncanonical pyrimidine nucleotidase [Clostridia bacterium]
MIKTVFFDLDDTLFDFQKAERIAISETFKVLGIEPTQDKIALYNRKNQEEWLLLEQGKTDRQTLKWHRFYTTFSELGLSFDPRETADIYATFLSRGHYYIEGAENLLKELYPLYDLYLLSNGFSRTQRGRLKGSCLETYMKKIFISQEIGADKPNPLFFERCFAQIPSFRREEAVIVGDSLSSDITGGIAAGLHTLWFSRSTTVPDGKPKPEKTVKRLSDIPRVLKEFS